MQESMSNQVGQRITWSLQRLEPQCSGNLTFQAVHVRGAYEQRLTTTRVMETQTGGREKEIEFQIFFFDTKEYWCLFTGQIVAQVFF